jgi:hypothetical protein
VLRSRLVGRQAELDMLEKQIAEVVTDAIREVVEAVRSGVTRLAR